MNTNRTYTDNQGIQYKCVGFKAGQYKMEVVDSPYPHINEGVTQLMDELPSVSSNSDITSEPTNNLNNLESYE